MLKEDDEQNNVMQSRATVCYDETIGKKIFK